MLQEIFDIWKSVIAKFEMQMIFLQGLIDYKVKWNKQENDKLQQKVIVDYAINVLVGFDGIKYQIHNSQINEIVNEVVSRYRIKERDNQNETSMSYPITDEEDLKNNYVIAKKHNELDNITDWIDFFKFIKDKLLQIIAITRKRLN